MKKLFLLFIAFICIGCSQKIEQPSPAQLEGRWVPVFLADLASTKAPDTSSTWGQPFINFAQSGEVNGMSGVNLFGGHYKVDDKNLSFSGMYSTRRAGEFGEYEHKFLKVLSDVDSYSINGNELELKQQKKILLKLKKEEAKTLKK